MTLRNFKHLVNSSAAYPLTGVYVAGVLVAVGVSQGVIDLTVGLLAFTLVTVVSFLIAMMREIRSVRLVLAAQERAHFAQSEQLARRIEQLVLAMEHAGVAIPDSSTRDD